MSHRLSRKVGVNYTEPEAEETVILKTASTKKSGKAPKVKTDISKENTKLAIQRKQVKAESGSEEEAVAPARKISSVRGKKTLEEDKKSKKAPTKRKAKPEESGEEGDEPQIKKQRKTKEEKESETMPIAERSVVSTLKKAMHIGAHVSAAKGVQNSVTNARHIGGNAFALFLKSQRKWSSPPLDSDARDKFKAFCEEHKFDAAKHVLPHGSYLVNLAQKEAAKADQAYDCFLDDLQRCEQLGIKLYNFHPGNTGKEPRPEAIGRIAAQLNKAHKATKTVVTVLENMAGDGNVVGSTWADLRDIIALIDDKTRVGVCIDTCHAFAAGYDLRSPEAFQKTMDDFSSTVGMRYLKALHLNDSKAPFSSHRDLHANIGTGFLGLRAFHNVVNFTPFQDLPMVLETPTDKKGPDGKMFEDKAVWAAEIKLLEGLIAADPESDVFKEDEQRLYDAGADERKKIQAQVDKKKGLADKKQQKTLESMFKKSSPKKKKAVTKDESDDSDASEEACNH